MNKGGLSLTCCHPNYCVSMSWNEDFYVQRTVIKDFLIPNSRKIWGDALQTITSPKPSPPPTLKSWQLYRWNRFKQRTDKWGLLQWYLVILGIIACILFSSLYQNRVMDLDRTNRIFYKEVIMDEKRKERYHELDSLIHSDSFFRTYWSFGTLTTNTMRYGTGQFRIWKLPNPICWYFSDSFEETFIFFIQYFPNAIFATSFSDNQFKVRKLFKVSLYLAQGNAHILRHFRGIDLRCL